MKCTHGVLLTNYCGECNSEVTPENPEPVLKTKLIHFFEKHDERIWRSDEFEGEDPQCWIGGYNQAIKELRRDLL